MYRVLFFNFCKRHFFLKMWMIFRRRLHLTSFDYIPFFYGGFLFLNVFKEISMCSQVFFWSITISSLGNIILFVCFFFNKKNIGFSMTIRPICFSFLFFSFFFFFRYRRRRRSVGRKFPKKNLMTSSDFVERINQWKHHPSNTSTIDDVRCVEINWISSGSRPIAALSLSETESLSLSLFFFFFFFFFFRR